MLEDDDDVVGHVREGRVQVGGVLQQVQEAVQRHRVASAQFGGTEKAFDASVHQLHHFASLNFKILVGGC